MGKQVCMETNSVRVGEAEGLGSPGHKQVHTVLCCRVILLF